MFHAQDIRKQQLTLKIKTFFINHRVSIKLRSENADIVNRDFLLAKADQESLAYESGMLIKEMGWNPVIVHIVLGFFAWFDAFNNLDWLSK